MKHNREDYILTLWEMLESLGNVTEKMVSGRLGVSLPTAWEEIHLLEAEGLVTVGRGGLKFTSYGFKEAKRIVMAHRITEYFVYVYLEVPWDEVHRAVMDLEHDFTGKLLDNLYRKMGYPKYCPHGNPIKPDARIYELTPHQITDGNYYFVRSTYEDYNFLRRLMRGGILPGKRVRIEKGRECFYITGENGDVSIMKGYEGAIRISDKPINSGVPSESGWIS